MLHWACASSDLEAYRLAQELIKAGADPRAVADLVDGAKKEGSAKPGGTPRGNNITNSNAKAYSGDAKERSTSALDGVVEASHRP